MENFIILAGIIAILRAYWVYNLIRKEKKISKGNFSSFLRDKNKYNMYLLIRPFIGNMKDEKLKTRVNVLTYIIYVLFIIGIVSIILKNDFNY
jgi:uncharacterized membrane protein YbjE (DUF340 family)